MPSLLVSIVRFVHENPQPGIVECEFIDVLPIDGLPISSLCLRRRFALIS